MDLFQIAATEKFSVLLQGLTPDATVNVRLKKYWVDYRS